MAIKFFVKAKEKITGPFEMDVILEKVDAKEFAKTDSVYLYEQDEWMMISEIPEFIVQGPAPSSQAHAAQTLAAQTGRPTDTGASPVHQLGTASSTLASGAEWYVLKGKNRYGPFQYNDVVKMLQEKSIFEFDYAWSPAFENWMRIAEIPDFASEKIQTLLERDKKAGQIFFRRKFARTNYECPLIVHDNKRVWKGVSLDIGEGGASIAMENAMILPGQSVYVHFKGGNVTKPFNALCEVVCKHFVEGIKDSGQLVHYGLKFINIHKQDRDSIKTVVGKAA